MEINIRMDFVQKSCLLTIFAFDFWTSGVEHQFCSGF